jgi:hypothetical protein
MTILKISNYHKWLSNIGSSQMDDLYKFGSIVKEPNKKTLLTCMESHNWIFKQGHHSWTFFKRLALTGRRKNDKSGKYWFIFVCVNNVRSSESPVGLPFAWSGLFSWSKREYQTVVLTLRLTLAILAWNVRFPVLILSFLWLAETKRCGGISVEWFVRSHSRGLEQLPCKGCNKIYNLINVIQKRQSLASTIICVDSMTTVGRLL